jgi:AbrB family looped-hinge helix DNA binding protein
MNDTNTRQGSGVPTLIRMVRSGQVTLPSEVRKALRLEEGDYLEAAITEGVITLKPVTVIDRKAAVAELAAAHGGAGDIAKD